jgi:signal peptidase I
MSSTSGVRIPSPWLSLWLKPSGTIDRIVASDPRRRVLLLASLGGICGIALLLYANGLKPDLLDWRFAVAFVLAGIAGGIANLYIAGFIYKWSGKIVGGKASAREVRAALAWGSVPTMVACVICLVVVIWWGSPRLHGSLTSITIALIVGFTLIVSVLPLTLWSYVATLRMLARVQGFGFCRAVANLVLGVFSFSVAALFARSLLFEPFSIPSASMAPTLVVGDYLFVSKYSYGYSRYSLPWGLPLISGRIFQSSPQRGDVVVFRSGAGNETNYVKRVVGLPGDQIQVIGGVLLINGQPVKLDQAPDYVPEGSSQGVAQYIETLPNGVKHPILKRFPVAVGEVQPGAVATLSVVCGNPLDNVSIENFDPNNTPVYQVAPGHYLTMGDNRDNSLDSRFLREIGCPPAENLVGRAEIIFYSGDELAFKTPTTHRFERIGRTIE